MQSEQNTRTFECRSNVQLKILHCRGIEPRSPAWQARILPLNQQCSRVPGVLGYPTEPIIITHITQHRSQINYASFSNLARPVSSVGQSVVLITRMSWVRPPHWPEILRRIEESKNPTNPTKLDKGGLVVRPTDIKGLLLVLNIHFCC